MQRPVTRAWQCRQVGTGAPGQSLMQSAQVTFDQSPEKASSVRARPHAVERTLWLFGPDGGAGSAGRLEASRQAGHATLDQAPENASTRRARAQLVEVTLWVGRLAGTNPQY
jgi:hypothetical protein